MSVGSGPRVLHLVPPGGGGVDRCVRDIVRHRPGDAIVHVTDGQCVVELSQPARFSPLAPDDLVRHARDGALGSPLVLHAHSTVAAVRRICERLSATTGAPVLLTLHDVWFADPEVGDAELAERLAFVRAADLRLAPSHFIVDHLRRVLGDAVRCEWVPNGVGPTTQTPDPAISDAARQAIGEVGFAVAVIGAVGEHKGLSALEAIVRQLPESVRVVVFGYTGTQLRQGWAIEGRLWVHGVFEPHELAGLVAAYGARLAFFPPGMPESFCYALTDAWTSGLGVLAPDHGALSERVRQHGGGALYTPQTEVAGIAALVVQRLASATRAEAQVALERPLPTMDEIMQAMNEHYRRVCIDTRARPADDEALHSLAQTHLDARFMRREVLDLQRALEHASQAVVAQQQRLAEREAELVAVRGERDAWQDRYGRLVERLQRPLRWLPEGARRRLAARARRLLGLTAGP